MLRLSVLLLAASVLLTSCALTSPSTPSATLKTVEDDTSLAITKLQMTVPLLPVSVLSPASAAKIESDLVQAAGFLQAIGPSTVDSAAQTLLARVEGPFNDALSYLPSVLPPPYNLFVVAASVVADSLESYLSSVLPVPGPTPAAARMARLNKNGMTLMQARKTLSGG